MALIPKALLPKVSLVILSITHPLYESFNDVLPLAPRLAAGIPGPRGRLTAHGSPIPPHVTGYAFDVGGGDGKPVDVEAAADIIDIFPPVRLSVSARLRAQSAKIHDGNTVSTDFDIDALIAREMLSEATDHVHFPPSSASSYDSVSVHSAWSQQALSGCTEVRASGERGAKR